MIGAERRGVSRRKVIDEAKSKVSTLQLAERLCAEQGKALRRAGRELLTNCLLPDHEDRTPSFCVDPEKDLWFCHGCVRGGDAVELARFAWGYSKVEVAMAAAELLHVFGQEIPPRPATWHAKQKRQQPLRDAIGRARFEHLRRRLFRRFFEPCLLRTKDPDERRAEAEALWQATEFLARLLVARIAAWGGDG